jgi:hypothetical protein
MTDTTHPDLLADLASWLELRLHEADDWRSPSRLYGLTVLDPDALGRNADSAAAFTFLAEGEVYALLECPAVVAAATFDALGIACTGTATRLDTGERYRCRTVLVADGTGQSTVNRLRGEAPERMGRASGPVADRVELLFRALRSTESRPAT